MNTKPLLDDIYEALKNPLTYAFSGVPSYAKTFIVPEGNICHDCVRSNLSSVINDVQSNQGSWNIRTGIVLDQGISCIHCKAPILIHEPIHR